jgi:deoxyadenosine/deoxycytidine kinase
MERWSFNLQIYFLNSRFRQVMQIREVVKKSYKNHLWRCAYFCTQLVCDGLNDQSWLPELLSLLNWWNLL